MSPSASDSSCRFYYEALASDIRLGVYGQWLYESDGRHSVSPWTIMAVLGAAALPHLLRPSLPVRRLRQWALTPLVAVVVAVGLLLTRGWGPIGFAFLMSWGLVLEEGRFQMVDDFERRRELGLPALMRKGDPATRGLFDPVWIVRYRHRMRRQPLGGAHPSVKCRAQSGS